MARSDKKRRRSISDGKSKLRIEQIFEPSDPEKLQEILSKAFRTVTPEELEMFQAFMKNTNMSIERLEELLTQQPSIADLPAWQSNSQALNTIYERGITYGLVIGAATLFFGFILTILGFARVIEFGLEGAGFSIRLLTASPGVFFALVGLIIIVRYKPKITRNSISTQHAVDGGVSYYRQENTTSGARLAQSPDVRPF